jgi:hypothetical protein
MPSHTPSTGLSLANWIAKVRDLVEDPPIWKTESHTGDSTTGGLTATSSPWKTSWAPLNDTDVKGVQKDPLVSVNGAAQTVVYTGTPIAGQVLVNLDTGELIFGTIPGAVTIAMGYYRCRWRDQKILDALMEGLHRCWPAIGRYHTDLTIRPTILNWDYQLAPWAQTEESRILEVEYRDPDISTEPWRSLGGLWRRSTLGTIHIYPSQQISLAGRFRVYGYGPCLELGDLPPQYFDLPVWYAAGSLLMKKEAPRARIDTQAPQANEGATQPGASATAGKEYMDMFREALSNILSRKAAPIGYRMRTVSTYAQRPR